MPDLRLLTSAASNDTLCDLPLKQLAVRTPPAAWNIRVSPAIALSRNPIRSTIASVTSTPPQTTKAPINLGLGDPTSYPLHPPPPTTSAAIITAVSGERSNGYVPGAGTTTARQAVADYHERWDRVQYDADDITLTHGVGQALDMLFSVLCPHSRIEQTNVLLPRPVFAQYPMLLANLGVEARFYDCIEENGWEADLDMLRSLVDERTRAIVVTNPSNPCGTNFSAKHISDILAVAEEWKVPIIADEIYGHITWSTPFTPLASLSNSVPILTLSGLSKRFLLPGWRVGWIALHDPLGVAGPIREGLAVWANRYFGPSSLTQAALPEILLTPDAWHAEVLAKVKLNAEIMTSSINQIPGISCVAPTGALYMLVRIDPLSFPEFTDDVDFCAALYREEAVFVLPGQCFEAVGYFRVVLASPAEIMREVGVRLAEFCARHRVL
ncbi:pyridoxal phosphate-dependent transferase [Dioszegia hungarica]|uniref:Pyridoxal phosphate-dependent transferase n=1 Tax=Dioszegia hungarica TaxID=4972 RepID=A0AA38LVI1_9TREE|nr:pyridoxal phosphate-dependent transferase [Dioszegia hungarica]KAI9635759.1 pyridoxal phosphate-dependent transferase [Dioszegia hungarica]